MQVDHSKSLSGGEGGGVSKQTDRHVIATEPNIAGGFQFKLGAIGGIRPCPFHPLGDWDVCTVELECLAGNDITRLKVATQCIGHLYQGYLNSHCRNGRCCVATAVDTDDYFVGCQYITGLRGDKVVVVNPPGCSIEVVGRFVVGVVLKGLTEGEVGGYRTSVCDKTTHADVVTRGVGES